MWIAKRSTTRRKPIDPLCPTCCYNHEIQGDVEIMKLDNSKWPFGRTGFLNKKMKMKTK
ncbi:hypothetical protein HOE22_09350 [Candidatus Woesearchaeota archaeon]|jgi:hypothetical protein|nr:hypothetical protein [Candidatus Woesearchaeota archaeon]MBT7557463.1 hypothetical protein [Candidatus Woesearchaeota archaeon]